MVEALIWSAAIVAIGGVLVLERRCLGQMALVQPLALCLLAGWYTGDTATAVWLGVSIQLLSMAPGNQADWALAGVICAVAILLGERLGLAFHPAGPAASAVIVVAVLVAIGARTAERWLARFDGARLRLHSPWSAARPEAALGSRVRRAVLRNLTIGGLEAAAGSGAALGVMHALDRYAQPGSPWDQICLIAVPTVGVAVAVGALSGFRYVAVTAATMALSWAVLT